MEELQQNKSALEGSGKPLLKNTNFLFLWAATLFSSFAYGDDSIDSKRRNDGASNEFTYAIINGLYPALLCIHINRACNRNSNCNRYEKWCNRRYRLCTICSDSRSSCKKV